MAALDAVRQRNRGRVFIVAVLLASSIMGFVVYSNVLPDIHMTFLPYNHVIRSYITNDGIILSTEVQIPPISDTQEGKDFLSRKNNKKDGSRNIPVRSSNRNNAIGIPIPSFSTNISISSSNRAESANVEIFNSRDLRRTYGVGDTVSQPRSQHTDVIIPPSASAFKGNGIFHDERRPRERRPRERYTDTRITHQQQLCPVRENYTLESSPLKYTSENIPKDLYKLAPKVFDEFPTTFLDGYNSPCWWNNENQQKVVVCLPKFFLAGVAKCGTTDLWMKITSHPQIIHTSEKEPRWWTRKRLGKHERLQSFEGYLQQFASLSKRMRGNPHVARKLISGDGSPSVFWDNMNWREYVPATCKSGPTYVIADVIRTVLPQSKIIIIFRNPTDRMYSDYMFTGAKSRSPQSFHRHVVASTNMLQKCLNKGRNIRSCVYHFIKWDLLGKDQPMMLIKGLYSIFTRDWLTAFPRNQLMFIRFEDWYQKCVDILPAIYKFLALDSLSSYEINKICLKKNPTKKKNTKGPMLEKTRHVLDEFYRASREDLAHILEDNRWKEWT